MYIIALSDFHLGKGQFLKNGQLNILEDFDEDDRFIEFLDFYSAGKNYWTPIHLVLNGDILNLIQIDINGVYTHVIDEDHVINALNRIVDGHVSFFNGLTDFLSRPNKKITYIIGNHDAGMGFTKVQERFREIVGAGVKFAFSENIAGVHVEHGHRFEVINAVDRSRYFIEGPNGKKILNLPWGSLFCVSLLPKLKKERPYIDKVRPMSGYIKWTFFHDPIFFWRICFILLRYFIVTSLSAYTKHNGNFRTTFGLLKQITIYPSFGKKAKRILKRDRNIHTVILGHTHLNEWRKFPEQKYYFNTGTWNSIPSVDAALHESNTKLTYVLIDINEKNHHVNSAALKVWHGKWRPFRDEIIVT